MAFSPSALFRALLELVNYSVEIRIACAKASGEPVAAALGDCFAISDHVKLTSVAGRNHGVNAETLFDQGHETRDLGLVVPSRGTGAYLDFHAVLQAVAVEQSRRPYRLYAVFYA
jgi:hypothetical protein